MNSENLIKFSIHNLLKIGLGIVILIFSISLVFSQNNNSPFIYVLGNVQDAGLPHIGCDEEICINPENNSPIYLKNGKFGTYLNCEKKNKSLLPGMVENDVTPKLAIAIINLPKSIRIYVHRHIL